VQALRPCEGLAHTVSPAVYRLETVGVSGVVARDALLCASVHFSGKDCALTLS